MASIISIELTIVQGADPQVSLSLGFTVREIAEDYMYGVNIAIVRARPGQAIIVRHKGFDAMEFFALPLNMTPDLQVGYTSTTTRPSGNAVVNLSVAVQLTSLVVSGERLQTFATVVPEIAEMIGFSQEVVIP